MTTEIERLRAELAARFPGWHIWVVHKAVGGYVWCARRDGAAVAEFNAGTVSELAADLDQAEARET